MRWLIANEASSAGLAILISNKPIDLADFALQEQLEDNLVVAVSQVWYNGSYTMAAKPIKSLELH